MMKQNIRVCHFTSVHDQLDDRIYLKECCSLFQAGYEVYIVARGESKNINGIHIIGCGKPKNRIARILFFSKKIYRVACKLDCDIYHFHDPELLPYGLRLSRQGKKVIFDSHEDVPAQILDKYWIPQVVREIVSMIYKKYETHALKKFDATVAATNHIAKQFQGRGRNITVINNYPRLDDIVFQESDFELRDNIICYAGGISDIRGETVMINAIEKTDANLYLAGQWNINGGNIPEHVKYLGKIDRNQVNDLYGKSIAGVLLYQPAKNHFESQPIKLFEYMAAGLPVIASDFELWKKIVEGNSCGICVNPTDVNAIVEAIVILLKDKKMAQTMGECGYKAVTEKYNWKIEEKKLVALYMRILNC